MDAPTVEQRQEVWYWPDVCFRFAKVSRDKYAFGFVYAKGGRIRVKEGDPVDDDTLNRNPPGISSRKGDLTLARSGAAVTLGKPNQPWAAKVVKQYDDGSCDLEITQPPGTTTLECPKVPWADKDAVKLHSWHLKDQ
jgi:hypothetical protein